MKSAVNRAFGRLSRDNFLANDVSQPHASIAIDIQSVRGAHGRKAVRIYMCAYGPGPLGLVESKRLFAKFKPPIVIDGHIFTVCTHRSDARPLSALVPGQCHQFDFHGSAPVRAGVDQVARVGGHRHGRRLSTLGKAGAK